MDSQHVTVVDKWTARTDSITELTGIHRDVVAAMDQPEQEAVDVYASEADNALYVRDALADAAGFDR